MRGWRCALAKLPYCSQYQGPAPVKFRRPCEFKDAQDIFIIEEMSAFTATRVSESAEVRRGPRSKAQSAVAIVTPPLPPVQVRVCGTTKSECSELFRSVGKSSYFPADVEAYTFLVDHNFRTAAIGVNGAPLRSAPRRGPPAPTRVPDDHRDAFPSLCPPPHSKLALCDGGAARGGKQRPLQEDARRLGADGPLHHPPQHHLCQDRARRVSLRVRPAQAAAAMHPAAAKPPAGRSRALARRLGGCR